MAAAALATAAFTAKEARAISFLLGWGEAAGEGGGWGGKGLLGAVFGLFGSSSFFFYFGLT